MPMKLAKVSRNTAKYSGELNCRANSVTQPESSVITTTPNSAPVPADMKASVRACAACPCCAIG